MEILYIKQWCNSKKIYFYNRYVHDTLIIYDANHITEEKIIQYFHEVDTNLRFKLTLQTKKIYQFLVVNIKRNPDKIQLVIYRTETNTDITIHNNKTHTHWHNNVACTFYISRLTNLKITKK